MEASLPRPAGSFRSKIAVILMLAGIFLLNFLSRVVLGPLMPFIEKDLSIGHTQAGSLFLLTSFGYFVTLAASGFVSARLGHRRTIILSALAVGLALLLVSLGRSLTQMRLTLVILGLATGLYLPSAMATITTLVSRRNWGKAVAIHELAPNLGLLLAPLLAEAFLRSTGWRPLLMLLGALSLLAGGAFHLFGRGGDSPGQAPSPAII
ncbi:MAG: MFS transporter, partial [Thermodesulfobacteriota bacterium]